MPPADLLGTRPRDCDRLRPLTARPYRSLIPRSAHSQPTLCSRFHSSREGRERQRHSLRWRGPVAAAGVSHHIVMHTTPPCQTRHTHTHTHCPYYRGGSTYKSWDARTHGRRRGACGEVRNRDQTSLVAGVFVQHSSGADHGCGRQVCHLVQRPAGHHLDGNTAALSASYAHPQPVQRCEGKMAKYSRAVLYEPGSGSTRRRSPGSPWWRHRTHSAAQPSQPTCRCCSSREPATASVFRDTRAPLPVRYVIWTPWVPYRVGVSVYSETPDSPSPPAAAWRWRR
jgi:hypothetical protein